MSETRRSWQGLPQCGKGQLYSTVIICPPTAERPHVMRLNYNTAVVGDKVELLPYRPEHVPVKIWVDQSCVNKQDNQPLQHCRCTISGWRTLR